MVAFVHVAFSIISLALGGFVFVNVKATRLHRWIGRLYAVSMVAMDLTALDIYKLTGRFNFFHVTAIVSLAMVLTGWAQVFFRHRLRNWLYRHYVYMSWSYVALIAAALNEGFVRLGFLKALVRHTGNWGHHRNTGGTSERGCCAD